MGSYTLIIGHVHAAASGVGLLIALLVLALLLGGLGFAVHALWIVAVVLALVWLIGFFIGGAERGRWYGRSS